MLKRILGRFKSPDKKEAVPPQRATEIERLLAAHRRRLQQLEQRQALYGPEAPPALEIEIADIKAQIAALTAGAVPASGPDDRQTLAALTRRQIHRRNLTRLQAQLKAQQLELSPEQLQKTLHPLIITTQEAIQALEQQARLNPQQRHEQELLAVHRRNLTFYQEMLAGARPYAPVALLNQIAVEEQALEAIDDQLAGIK